MLCQLGPCHYPLDGKILCATQNNKMIEVPNGFNHLMNKYLNCLIMISNISVYIYIYTYIFKSICMLNVVKLVVPILIFIDMKAFQFIMPKL